MSEVTTISSAVVLGAKAFPCSVEVALREGLPGFEILGIKGFRAAELKTIVTTAIRSAGYSMPSSSILVNVSPQNISKSTDGFALPIAVGILVATKQINPESVSKYLFFGNLDLAGSAVSARGAVLVASCAAKQNQAAVVAKSDAFTFDNVLAYGLDNLSFLRNYPFTFAEPSKVSNPTSDAALDFAEIACPDYVGFAIQVAIVSGCGLMMIGDEQLATDIIKRIPSIMPAMLKAEQLETAEIRSASGENPIISFSSTRPVRTPHWTCTAAGLLGGGNPIRPGEVSLAHHGILALVGIENFKTNTLLLLNAPIEEKKVTITRAGGVYDFPANVLLVATAAPCPCGNFGSSLHECSCSETALRHFSKRLFGPLADLLRIKIELPEPNINALSDSSNLQTTEELAKGVAAGLAFKRLREARCAQESAPTDANSIFNYLLTKDAKATLVKFSDTLDLTYKQIKALLSIARGIADIENSFLIRAEDVFHARNWLNLSR